MPTSNVSKIGKSTPVFLERTVCSKFGTDRVLVTSCTIAPPRLRPINILRVPVDDHFPAYSCTPATNVSIAKLSARASVHSTTGSLRRKKRTSTIPGQTTRNQNTMSGRIAAPVNTKFTRQAATAESMITRGHNQFDRTGISSHVFDTDGAGIVDEDSTG